MSPFSNLKSHKDSFKELLLTEHLSQVESIAGELIRRKKIQFRFIPEIALQEMISAVGLSHDLGKGTSYFQDYLSNGKRFPSGEQRHSGLSALLSYKVFLDICEKYDMPDVFALAPIIAVVSHHKGISKLEFGDEIMEERINNFYQELLSWERLTSTGGGEYQVPADPIEATCEIEDLFSELTIIHDLDLKYEFRLLALLILSILLESDRAYLAVDDPAQYQRSQLFLSPKLVDTYKDKKFVPRQLDLFNLHSRESTLEINRLRNKAYDEVIQKLNKIDLSQRLYSLTLPTGMGKTLLAASWALKLRHILESELRCTPQIIVTLPFLSIIEQTAKQYEDLLSIDTGIIARNKTKHTLPTANNEDIHIPEDILLKSHSLSSMAYKDSNDKAAEYFISIWNSQIIITTFDQLLYALFSFETKHLLRFHNLMNSIIIMDEIQALPPRLWHPFSEFFKHLTTISNSYLLLMSATQSGCIDEAQELVSENTASTHHNGPERYFILMNRYILEIDAIDKTCLLDDFLINLRDYLPKTENKIMIVLNTRDSARKVYEALAKDETSRDGRTLLFLTSYIIPKERLNRIKQIQEAHRCIVVATQCIEAGVDIDMDYIIRDFAPLDSIIQVAGRCNRHGKRNHPQTVRIIRLCKNDKVKSSEEVSGKNKKVSQNPENLSLEHTEFSRMVYDPLSLDATMLLLKNRKRIPESEIFKLGTAYFNELKRKDLGVKRTECLLDFSHTYRIEGKNKPFDIQKELRGDIKQYSVIVDMDEKLRIKIEHVLQSFQDRWERRRALKHLAPEIAESSISINAYKVNPEEIADKGPGNYYFLRPTYYDPEVGFNYENTSESHSVFF